jgi:hypothetical protein
VVCDGIIGDDIVMVLVMWGWYGMVIVSWKMDLDNSGI